MFVNKPLRLNPLIKMKANDNQPGFCQKPTVTKDSIDQMAALMDSWGFDQKQKDAWTASLMTYAVNMSNDVISTHEQIHKRIRHTRALQTAAAVSAVDVLVELIDELGGAESEMVLAFLFEQLGAYNFNQENK